MENRGQPPSLNVLFKIAMLLEISIDQFFFPAKCSGKNERRKHIDQLLNGMDDRPDSAALEILRGGTEELPDLRQLPVPGPQGGVEVSTIQFPLPISITSIHSEFVLIFTPNSAILLAEGGGVDAKYSSYFRFAQ